MIVDVDAAVAALLRGEVVAYPTETVYGLGVVADDAIARARLERLKGRAADKGLSVLVRDLAELEGRAGPLPEVARRLAQRFWPGPLTLVLPVADGALRSLATSRGVGFRCSPHETAQALLRATGRPLISTSCNESGAPPCATPREIERRLGSELPVCAGPAPTGGAPSTVVACDRSGRLELLREGALEASQVFEAAA